MINLLNPKRQPQSLILLVTFALAHGSAFAAANWPALHDAAFSIQGEGVDQGATVATDQPDFEFRSGFWMNLHHFLFLQAVLAAPDSRKGHAEFSARDSAGAHKMSAEQTLAWNKAVAYYARFGKLDPLADQELILVNYELSDAGNSPTLEGRKLPPELKSALETAAPVYRALWWEEQDRLNRRWIAAAAKLVGQYSAIGPKIASLYKTDWPGEKTPVEVTLYANWAGAYTVIGSTLITISSVDPGDQGNAALETLFHEASHALVDSLGQQLAADIRKVNKTPTFQLVHAIIFYTAGAVTSKVLERNGVRGYVPYALKNGLYTRVPVWTHYREICERDWQPYIDGKITYEEALSRIANDL